MKLIWYTSPVFHNAEMETHATLVIVLYFLKEGLTLSLMAEITQYRKLHLNTVLLYLY